MTFTVEIRDDCKVCGGKLPNTRHRTYCSAVCRNKEQNKKQAAYHAEYQKKRSAERSMKPDPNKVQCMVCGKWFVQLCSHTWQVHALTGREYREKFDLEVKRGVVPAWYRALKGEQALDNETYKNLENGAKFRYKKAGHYHRSPVTVMRLKDLYKYKKQ